MSKSKELSKLYKVDREGFLETGDFRYLSERDGIYYLSIYGREFKGKRIKPDVCRKENACYFHIDAGTHIHLVAYGIIYANEKTGKVWIAGDVINEYEDHLGSSYDGYGEISESEESQSEGEEDKGVKAVESGGEGEEEKDVKAVGVGVSEAEAEAEEEEGVKGEEEEGVKGVGVGVGEEGVKGVEEDEDDEDDESDDGEEVVSVEEEDEDDESDDGEKKKGVMIDLSKYEYHHLTPPLVVKIPKEHDEPLIDVKSRNRWRAQITEEAVRTMRKHMADDADFFEGWIDNERMVNYRGEDCFSEIDLVWFGMIADIENEIEDDEIEQGGAANANANDGRSPSKSDERLEPRTDIKVNNEGAAEDSEKSNKRRRR